MLGVDKGQNNDANRIEPVPASVEASREFETENLDAPAIVSGDASAYSPSQEVRDGAAGANTKAKLEEFWASTPLWSGISMLLAVIFNHVSSVLLFVLAWMLAVGEFIRVGFFTRKWQTICFNTLFAIFLGVIFFGIWKVTPAQSSVPSLDQQMQNLASKFPPLVSGVLRTKPLYNSTQEIITYPPSMGGRSSMNLDNIASLDLLTADKGDQITLVLNATTLTLPNAEIITGQHPEFVFDSGANKRHQIQVEARKFLVTLLHVEAHPTPNFGWTPKVFVFGISEK